MPPREAKRFYCPAASMLCDSLQGSIYSRCWCRRPSPPAIAHIWVTK